MPQAVELPEERPAEFLSGAAGAHAGLGPAASRAARLPFCRRGPQLVVRRGSLGKALRSFSAKPPGPSFHTVSLLSALCPFPYRIISLYPSAKSGRSRLSGAGPRAAPGRPPWLRAPSSQRCAGRGAGRANPGRPAPRVFPRGLRPRQRCVRETPLGIGLTGGCVFTTAESRPLKNVASRSP